MCDSTVYNPYTSLLPFAISFAFSLSLSLSLPLASSSSLFLSISLSLLASIRSIQRTRCLNYEHLVHLVAYLFPLNIDWILGWKGGGKGRFKINERRSCDGRKKKKRKKTFFSTIFRFFRRSFFISFSLLFSPFHDFSSPPPCRTAICIRSNLSAFSRINFSTISKI